MSVLKLEKSNCKNCYKCIRNCPIKAIEFVHEQAQIIENDCVMCGKCILICPQNAKYVRSDIDAVRDICAGNAPVIALVAPSFISAYGLSSFSQMEDALKKLGFESAYEVAEGAYLVKTEYEKRIRENGGKSIITSCCPTVNMLVEKHFPAALPYLAPVITPMEASARLALQRCPEGKIVFIGPCVSKKGECDRKDSSVDFVLTFEELTTWFSQSDLLFEPAENLDAPRLSRFFPITGGILNTMHRQEDVNYFAVDGMEECMAVLKEISLGKLENCFIEMGACKGSCAGGPMAGDVQLTPIRAKVGITRHAGSSADFDCADLVALDQKYKSTNIEIAPPDESQISAVLRKMGKTRPEHELNCGTCGYETCREKAIAVFFGKADISMCLPFMKERAESLSGKILDATPNATVTVNEQLQVQHINNAACALFSITDPKDIIGSPVSRIMDEFDFVSAISSGEHSIKRKTFLADYGKYVEQIMILDPHNHMVICIMQDITQKEKKHRDLSKRKSDASQITDQIVEKQLRIVHEIASLLGETAAETKIALTELKRTIVMEEDEQ